MQTNHISISLDVKNLASREFSGLGSVFRNVDLGGDIVVPGAFKRSLAEHKSSGSLPPMFWMHNPAQVPGVWKEMREENDGLFVKGELVDTPLGNEMRTLLQHKAVRGMSIGYKANDIDFDEDGNRLLKDLDLWEVSIVSLAMNPLAQVTAAKSRLSVHGEYIPTHREFERILRDAGCSRKVAMQIVSAVADAEDDIDHELSGTPNSLRDAGAVDEEQMKAVADALSRHVDVMVSGIFRL